jgi:hypothetical protein
VETAKTIRNTLILLPALLLLAFSPAEAADSGTKRAILIGINKYQELPWLSGSTNDVEVMRNVLISRYGFKASNIETLLNEQATRAGILTALTNFVAKAGPNDTVYIHYSGHGSQVEDQNNEEPDGLDETICPYDARTDNVPDITDDELARILDKLNVTSAVVVLDSCHSGTALRAAVSDIRSRSVPIDTRIKLYQPTTTTRGVVALPENGSYVLFSAAAANQQELDGPFGPGGKPLGLLTATLSTTLDALKSEATPKQLIVGVEQNVEKLKPMFAGHAIPEAQLEGPKALINKPLFSPVNGGVQPTVLSKASKKKPSKASRKKVFVKKNKRRLLKRAIPDNADIDWVDDTTQADTVIDCTDDGNCHIYGPDGLVRVATIPAADLNSAANDGNGITSRYAQAVFNADSVAELLSVNATSGAINLELSATGRAGSSINPEGTRGIKITASVVNHQIGFYKPGETRTDLNSLQLSVRADSDCYLTLVTVDTAGTVTQLLPNPIQIQRGFMPDGLLRANRTYLVPDSFADSNRAGFHLDYAPPAGTDTVRAFCTDDLETSAAIRTDIADIADGQQGVSLSETLIAARGLTGLRPGQANSQSSSSSDTTPLWGSATITIDIAAR